MRADHVHALRVRPVVLPMAVPAQMAGGTMTSNPVVLIDLRDGEGRVGRSYLRTYSAAPLPALVRLVEDLADELVVGRLITAEELAARTPYALRILGLRGLVGMALAGLDMALWDLRAQAAQQPLAALLGARADTVAAYATLRSRDPRDAEPEAATAVASGFTALKVKLGGRPLDADAALVAAVRGAAGPAVEIMGDFNQSLAVEDAVARAAQLDALGLAWIEEPASAPDLVGHARIAEALGTPVQLGENLDGAEDVRQAIALAACDLLTLDAMRVGGVTGWTAASALASEAGLRVSSHAFPEFSVHLLAASPTAHWLEHLDHLAPIRDGALEVRDGRVHVPTGPGAGLRWDEDAVARLGA
jgi:mandelate racemase